MDRAEFGDQLKKNGISPEIVSFNNSVNEGYNIRKNRLCWETFVRERGVEYDCMGFPSESDALQYMLNQLVSIYSKND